MGYIFAVLFGAAVTFAVYPEQQGQQDTLIVTQVIEKEPVIYTKTIEKLKIDTLRMIDTLVVGDTLILRDTVIITEVAEMDTAFDEGHLDVKYYYVPKQFSLTWTPKPILKVYETVYKTNQTEPMWYEKPMVIFTAGLIVGGFIGTR